MEFNTEKLCVEMFIIVFQNVYNNFLYDRFRTHVNNYYSFSQQDEVYSMNSKKLFNLVSFSFKYVIY